MERRGQLSTAVLVAAFALGLGVRLWRLDAPVAGPHAWRQADTAGFARCFYEGGMNFFRPQVLWGGAGSGEALAELPIYPYVVAALYHVFGEQVAVPRAVSILCWMGAALVLLRLLRRRLGDDVAAWGVALFLLFPSGIYYSRVPMPEAMMVLCALLGIDLFAAWMERGGVARGIGAALATGLAIGIKIYNAWLGLPLVFLAWEKHGWRLFLRPALWGFGILSLGLPAAWYVHATELGRATGLVLFHWSPGVDQWLNFSTLADWGFYERIFGVHLPEIHLTYGGLALALAGAWLSRRDAGARLFHYWALGFAVYLLLVSFGNYEHDYYQLLLLPAAAGYAGVALGRGLVEAARPAVRIAAAVLGVGFLVLSALRVGGYAKLERAGAPAQRLGVRLGAVAPNGARVAVFDDRLSPILLYHAHRRGWVLGVPWVNEERILDVVREGAAALAGLKRHFAGEHGARLLAWLRETFVVAWEDADGIVFIAPRRQRPV